MDKTLVEKIKDWALDNYEKSFGASCIIECMTDEEIAEEFKSLADAQDFADLKSEQYKNAQDY